MRAYTIMTIHKIISGGQTGADQAALDAAIGMGIPHGGWIPKGRLTEEGPAPEKYNLEEMETERYEKRTEQNVIDSDGTVIYSHGALSGGSLYTQEMAQKHGRPFLHVNLGRMRSLEASLATGKWVAENGIGVLNVAGPRASKDPDIYRKVKGILEGAVNLRQAKAAEGGGFSGPQSEEKLMPKTVHEAVAQLEAKLSLEDRARIANMSIGEVELLDASLGSYIRQNFKLGQGNTDLLASCGFKVKVRDIDPDRAAAVIIDALWRHLQETHKLRVVR